MINFLIKLAPIKRLRYLWAVKIAKVSIWIWAIGLILVVSAAIVIADISQAKKSKIESQEIGANLNSKKKNHPSSNPDRIQTKDSVIVARMNIDDGSIPSSFLPASLNDWRLGRSLSDFKKSVAGLEYKISDDFRIITTKTDPCQGVVEITAYFDLSSENLLYELIVKYSSESEFDNAFGKVMNYSKWRDNWLIPCNDDTYVRVWSFDKTFVYKYLGAGPEHEQGGVTTAQQMEERRLLKLLK